MAKRRYGFDEAKITRYFKQGRGLGTGKDYQPWLTIQDVPSLGRSSRVPGATTGRLHHLLSDIETSAFYLYDWDEAVTDIREQFPLDRDHTRQIADEMGVAHPKDRKSGVALVMTTDLLIDVRRERNTIELARAIKPAAVLADRRTLEKLEIERRYWEPPATPWGLLTEREYAKHRVANLRWLAEMRNLDHLAVPHPDYWADRCQRVASALLASTGAAIDVVFAELERVHGLPRDEALTALRHLLATKQIAMNLDAPFDVTAPVASLSFPTNHAASRQVA